MQASGLVVLSALFVNLYINELITFTLVGVILLIMLWKVIFKTSNMDYWGKMSNEETKLEMCKQLLQ